MMHKSTLTQNSAKHCQNEIAIIIPLFLKILRYTLLFIDKIFLEIFQKKKIYHFLSVRAFGVSNFLAEMVDLFNTNIIFSKK